MMDDRHIYHFWLILPIVAVFGVGLAVYAIICAITHTLARLKGEPMSKERKPRWKWRKN